MFGELRCVFHLSFFLFFCFVFCFVFLFCFLSVNGWMGMDV